MKVCESFQKTIWHTIGNNQLYCWQSFKLPLTAEWSVSVPSPSKFMELKLTHAL